MVQVPTMEPPRNAVLGRWVNGELFVSINGSWRPVWMTMPMNVGAARMLQNHRMVENAEESDDEEPRIVMCDPGPGPGPGAGAPQVVAPRPKQRPVQPQGQSAQGPQPPSDPPPPNLLAS